MTEVEWLACADPSPMLEFLEGRSSGRKWRLFAVACCRRVWDQMTNTRSREAVETAERFADGLADDEALRVTYTAASDVAEVHPDDPYTWRFRPDKAAMYATPPPCGVGDSGFGYDTAWAVAGCDWDGPAAERVVQADLLRDLFGPVPFRPVVLNPSWLTPKVVDLARTMYDGQDFSRMPELAGLMETAGCTNREVLGHCRRPGPHVRGCWVVDLVSAKS
jgi:hypothetical protein